MIRFILFSVLLVLACGYALMRGGAPERIAAAILFLGSVLSPLVASAWLTRFQHVEHGMLMVDLIVFALFFILALTTRRFWPLWMTAMQGVNLVSHLSILAPDVIPRVYGNAVTLSIYPMLLVLVVATWRHQRRLAAYGADSSWAVSYTPSSPAMPPPSRRG